MSVYFDIVHLKEHSLRISAQTQYKNNIINNYVHVLIYLISTKLGYKHACHWVTLYAINIYI